MMMTYGPNISDQLISLWSWIKILGKFGHPNLRECFVWKIDEHGHGDWSAYSSDLRVESDTPRPSPPKHEPSSCLPHHRGILIPSMGFMLYVYIYISMIVIWFQRVGRHDDTDLHGAHLFGGELLQDDLYKGGARAEDEATDGADAWSHAGSPGRQHSGGMLGDRKDRN